MPLTIRGLQATDATAYRTSRLNALKLAPTAFSSSYETARDLPDTFFKERATFQPGNFIYGAFDDDRLIGTAGGFVDTELKCSHIGYVVGMWVEPAFRGKHLARALLDEVIQQFRTLGTIKTVQLGVTEGNEFARSLYQSAGFVEWGIEPDAILVDGKLYRQIHMAMTL